MQTSHHVSRAKKFLSTNYILVLFAVVALLGVMIFIYKTVMAKQHIVYARVKVSQGLWWASTVRPAAWMVSAFQKGDQELGFGSTPRVELLDVRSYPVGAYTSPEQYDVYLQLKMQVSRNPRTGVYTFKRSPLAVGSPVDLVFARVQTSGTVMELSDKPFEDHVIAYEVTIRKPRLSQEEYDAITIGDRYHDGAHDVIEILDKSGVATYDIPAGFPGVYYPESEQLYNATILVRLLLTQSRQGLLYRQEQPVQQGRRINLQTEGYFFDQYTVVDIKREEPASSKKE